jgi:hypothetical protein
MKEPEPEILTRLFSKFASKLHQVRPEPEAACIKKHY